MPGPRWKKVLSDLWSDPSRTVLVVLSIFIGVFATGVIQGARMIVVRELEHSYQHTNPAHASIRVTADDQFGDDLVEVVRKINGVAAAEGRRTASLQVETQPDIWDTLSLTAIADFDDMQINQFASVEGKAKPGDKEVLIERSSREQLNAKIGDYLTLKRSDGKQKIVQIVGVVHDLGVQPTAMTGTFYGYSTTSTMEWLGEGADYNQMLIRVAADAPVPTFPPSAAASHGNDTAHTNAAPPTEQTARPRANMSNARTPIAQSEGPIMVQVSATVDEVNGRIEKSGREPQVPRGPHGRISNEHWATSFINNLSTTMSVLGIMSLFLSAFLVTNTISALLAQQVKHIGIMKAIGARSHQMTQMYLVLVCCFGLLALLLAIPLTVWLCGILVPIVADYFNFDLSNATFPQDILMIQVFAGLIIPLIASIVPVINGTRMTVLDALNSDGIQVTTPKKKRLRIPNITSWFPQLLTRPLLLSVRNTFRRKARVSLTLLTLTVSGFIFIGIFSVRASLVQTLDDFLSREFQFDAVIMLERSYDDHYAVETVNHVPGVAAAEAWSDGAASRVYPNGNESEAIQITAVPPQTEMIHPVIIAGRWLLPEDENALIVSTGVLEDDPDITVGSTVQLTINDKESTWHVVGISTGMGTMRTGYTNYTYWNRVTGQVGDTRTLRVQLTDELTAEQVATLDALETYLEYQGMDVGRIFSMSEMQDRVTAQFDFIVMALLVMAVLMAFVGGLGLAGTMSLNVIERTREIGIMRAIGASNRMVLHIFLGEGLVIGILSWMFGTVLALPISKLLSDAMGQLFFRVPLSFHFSVEGVGVWLVFSLILAFVASLLPAWNATRLTVHHALASM
ncbi:MAG: ABC transporter permease [Chloroflexaceae bacterium]|nr:ABC transporter permease [Chloroflexaceae bacterium]